MKSSKAVNKVWPLRRVQSQKWWWISGQRRWKHRKWEGKSRGVWGGGVGGGATEEGGDVGVRLWGFEMVREDVGRVKAIRVWKEIDLNFLNIIFLIRPSK